MNQGLLQLKTASASAARRRQKTRITPPKELQNFASGEAKFCRCLFNHPMGYDIQN
jgi:hypothetical protein